MENHFKWLISICFQLVYSKSCRVTLTFLLQVVEFSEHRCIRDKMNMSDIYPQQVHLCKTYMKAICANTYSAFHIQLQTFHIFYQIVSLTIDKYEIHRAIQIFFISFIKSLESMLHFLAMPVLFPN